MHKNTKIYVHICLQRQFRDFTPFKKVYILFGPIFCLKKIAIDGVYMFFNYDFYFILLHVVIFEIKLKFSFCVLLIRIMLLNSFGKILYAGINVLKNKSSTADLKTIAKKYEFKKL